VQVSLSYRGAVNSRSVRRRTRGGGGSGRSRGGSPTAISAAGRFGGRLCLGFGVGRSGVGGRPAALRRVVVHVPARAFELQARRGEQPFHRPSALRAHFFGLSAETLNFLKSMAALRAAIRIQRQGHYLFGANCSTLSLYRESGGFLQEPAALRLRLTAERVSVRFDRHGRAHIFPSQRQ
jgi:hypothetical protein